MVSSCVVTCSEPAFKRTAYCLTLSWNCLPPSGKVTVDGIRNPLPAKLQNSPGLSQILLVFACIVYIPWGVLVGRQHVGDDPEPPRVDFLLRYWYHYWLCAIAMVHTVNSDGLTAARPCWVWLLWQPLHSFGENGAPTGTFIPPAERMLSQLRGVFRSKLHSDPDRAQARHRPNPRSQTCLSFPWTHGFACFACTRPVRQTAKPPCCTGATVCVHR